MAQNRNLHILSQRIGNFIAKKCQRQIVPGTVEVLQESACETLCTSATECATDNQNSLSVRAEDLRGQVPGRRLLEIWIEQLHEGGSEQREWVAADIEFLSECLFFSQSQAHGRFM